MPGSARKLSYTHIIRRVRGNGFNAGPQFNTASELTLRIGGVPEHFNLPWHLLMESGADRTLGIRLDWREFTTGTGAMLAELDAGRLDLAVLLTEGAALGVARGQPIDVLSLYTTSPLIWGVHVAPDSSFDSLDSIENACYGISRYGSGSHLMSLAMAIERGWNVEGRRFEIVDDMPGAAAALAQGRADVFLWEHFTTEPEVEAGHFRRIGDFVSPWPAWTVCGRREICQDQSTRLSALIESVADQAQRLAADEGAAQLIAARCGLRVPAVEKWLQHTRWIDGLTPADSALAAARDMLDRAGVI